MLATVALLALFAPVVPVGTTDPAPPAGDAAAAAATGLTDTELGAVLRGETPVRTEHFTTAKGRDAGRGLGAIAIARPVEEVWATLSRYEDRAEYVPRVKRVTVLDKTDRRVHVKQEVDATVTTARFTTFFTLDANARTIRWTLDDAAPDNTIAAVDGEYRLVPLGATRTLLVYRTYVDTGRSVPAFVADYMARRSIPDLLRAIKRRVESGGTWKK